MKILIIHTQNEPMMQINKKYLQCIKDVSKNSEIVVVKNQKEEVNKHKDAEIVLTASFSQIELNKFQLLKWIHVTSAGVNNVPKEIMNSNITLTNSSGVHPIPITEHVFGLILMFTRQLYKAYKTQLLERAWKRSAAEFKISELSGKTLAIVGMGRIGLRIANLAKAFEMKVIGVVRDPKKHAKSGEKVIGINKLNKTLPEADFIVNSLPSTNETFHLFDQTRFNLMKNTAYFINIGRGDTVDESDLISALKTNKIAGAGLDVFEKEPLTSSSELWRLENVVITPHYAGWTPQYMERVIAIFCENLRAYLKNKKMPQQVDKAKGY